MNVKQIEDIIDARFGVGAGRIVLRSFVVFPRMAFKNSIGLIAHDIAQEIDEEASDGR